MAKLSIKRPERIVAVCLDGALRAEYEAKKAELDELSQKKFVDNRLNDPAEKLRREIGDLWERQKTSTVHFRLQALRRADWDVLTEAHPAREGDKVDEHYGFNTATIFDAALSSEDPATIVGVEDADGKPVEFSPADWPEFSADLTRAQFEDFRVAISGLNGGDNAIPFSLPAYKATLSSADK